MKKRTESAALAEYLKTVKAENREEALSLLSVGTILKAETRYYLLADAIDGNINCFHSKAAIARVEARIDESDTIMERNFYGCKAAKAILALNSEVKKVVGKPFLKTFYNINGIKMSQRNISEINDILAAFDHELYIALCQLETAEAV